MFHALFDTLCCLRVCCIEFINQQIKSNQIELRLHIDMEMHAVGRCPFPICRAGMVMSFVFLNRVAYYFYGALDFALNK